MTRFLISTLYNEVVVWACIMPKRTVFN